MISEVTEYGFNFGSMSVTRVCSDKGVGVISVNTPKSTIKIRATKNGSVRFYDEQGEELELVNKKFIDNKE